MLCQTDPAAQPAYRGESLILVPKGAPGLEAAEVGDKMGIRMTSTAEVSFSGVRVPLENIVGQENRGFYQVLEFFEESRIEAARLLTYKAAWHVDQGKPDAKLTAMAKLYAGRTAVYVADEAVQIHGGYGYILENEVERYYRDAKITKLYEGTKEIQKNTIAGILIKKK